MAWRILTKASYAIEGERPPHNRAERRGHTIDQAGQQKLTLDEFIRLQKTVVENDRFSPSGVAHRRWVHWST